jgi:hypothetical protein
MGGVLDLEGLSFDYTFQFLVFHSQTSKKYEKMGSPIKRPSSRENSFPLKKKIFFFLTRLNSRVTS